MKKIVFLILVLSTCIYSQVERASRWQLLSAALAQQDTTKKVWMQIKDEDGTENILYEHGGLASSKL